MSWIVVSLWLGMQVVGCEPCCGPHESSRKPEVSTPARAFGPTVPGGAVATQTPAGSASLSESNS